MGLKYWSRHNRNDEPDTFLADQSGAVWEEMKQLDALSGGKLLRLRQRALRQWRLALAELIKRPDIADLRKAIQTQEKVNDLC